MKIMKTFADFSISQDKRMERLNRLQTLKLRRQRRKVKDMIKKNTTCKWTSKWFQCRLPKQSMTEPFRAANRLRSLIHRQMP